MRRIPLIAAVLALVTGLGLIVAVAVSAAGGGGDSPDPGAQSATSPTTSPTAAPEPNVAPSVQNPAPAPSAKVTIYRFPVQGLASYAKTHHDYPASDIMAACGTAVVAPVTGTVLEVSRVDTCDAEDNAGATRGGLSWSILGDDGVRYYGSHMSVVEPAIKAGARVTAGQRLGKVGKTGDTTACHLHFGISPKCSGTGDWWIRRGVVWPWSYLDAWRKGTPKSPVAAVGAWQREHGCPKKPLTNP